MIQDIVSNILPYIADNWWSVLSSLIIVLFLAWLLRTLLDRALNPIPEPFPFPILKQFPYLLCWLKKDGILGLIDHWSEKYKQFGLFRLNVLIGERVAVLDREFAKYILLAPSAKYGRNSPSIHASLPLLKGGLFTVNQKEHQRQKKLFNPVFTQETVNSFVGYFNNYANQLVKAWSSSKSEVDVMEGLDAFALDVLGESIFGYLFKALESGQSSVRRAFVQMLRGSFGPIVRPMLLAFPFIKHLHIRSIEEGDRAMKTTNEIVQNIIEEYQEKRKYDFGDEEHKNLMSMLISGSGEDNESDLTNQLLIPNVFTFLLAGHETTATTAMWTLYCLAKYPEEQRKVREEIRSVVESSDTIITEEHCIKMPYLSAVINEAMRLYTVAPLFFREALMDDTYNGRIIKKGTVFMIPAYRFHVDPDLWENPQQYTPERFLDDNDGKAHRDFTFVPFAAGPRMCIGRKFALLELKVVLAKLLHTLAFSVGDDVKFQRSLVITMKANPPIKFKISPAE